MQDQMPGRIWSARRQWLGNLIPLGSALLVIIATYRFGYIWQSLIGIIVAWDGVSRWGFYENDQIDQELRKKTEAEGELIGFVYLRPPTLLDAHAEIGLLTIEPGLLTIITEDETYSILRGNVRAVKTTMNIHSLLMLGGWIELVMSDGTFFKFESRKFRPMSWSRTRTRQLFLEIRAWKYEKAPA